MWVYSDYIWEKFQICVAICTYENQRRRRKKKTRSGPDSWVVQHVLWFRLDWLRKEGRKAQAGWKLQLQLYIPNAAVVLLHCALSLPRQLFSLYLR